MAWADNPAGSDADPAAAVASRGKPSAGIKFAYSMGQVIESGYLATNSFVFFYYTAVLGMSGSVVGAALAISLCVDAAADPLIGSWSDGLRSRLGRRVPAMLLGAPLTMLTMGLLFAPPSGLTPLLLFAWLTLTKIGVRGFASLYNIPYFALGGEMSDDHVERSQIVAIRLLSGIVITVLITAVAYSVFFSGVGGLQRPDRYPAFGWTIAGFMLVGALLCCAGVWRYAATLPQPTAKPEPMARRLPGEVAEVLSNPTFRTLFFSMLLFASAAGVHAALQNHAYVFVWKLRPETIQVLTYAYLAGILAGVPITPLLLRRIEKKTATILGLCLVTAGWIVLPGLRAAGLFAPTATDALLWLSLMGLVVGLGTGLIFIAYPSMMADAAEEHEHRYNARREGLFFSGLGFAGKAAGGVGTLVGGLALDALHFPREVGRQVGAVVPEEVLRSLIAAWGLLPAALAIVGIVVFAPYAVTRARHAVITTALRARRAEDVSAGRSS